MIHVKVDTQRCEGHGMCETTAPEVFVLDDDQVATVRLDPIAPERIQEAEAGVRACPVAALSLAGS